MNSKQALDFINRLLYEKAKPVLNESEETLFLGCWEGKTYGEIAAKLNIVNQSARDAGVKLFNKIIEELGITVSKRNFVNPIKYHYQQYSSQPKPAQEPTEEPNKSAELPEETNHNPFSPQNGRIDNPQLFFDRAQKIGCIFEVLNSGSNVALIGEEGIGKSSILQAICRLAESQLVLPRQPIFLNLNQIDNEDDFYCALCSEADIPESRGYRLTRNLEQRSKKLLLALDNVGQMTAFTRQVRDRLRGLAEGSNAPLKLILAANVSLNILFDDSQEGGKISPLAGICLEETIEPWDETTIRNFIEARLARTAVRFTEAEISQLVQESGGHPRRLMQGCYRIYAQYKQPGQ
jgi:hypothetical protein